jgi:RNA polymerase sigma-70 factor (ECF subfamily)
MSEHGETSDAQLVGWAQAGDGEAFAELFRRHYPGVLRACLRRIGPDGEEVAQAAFVRAFERIELCAGDQRFGAWVQVIARHRCADATRARVRAQALTGVSPPPSIEGPEEHTLRRERIEALSSVLLRLPRRQREVLLAREVDGRRPAEIAAALGVSLGAVDSLLLRARRAAAAGYRTMAAEQGVASVASTAVAALTAGGAAAAPPELWRVVRRGAESLWQAAVRLGAAGTAAASGIPLAAATAVLALAGLLGAPAHPDSISRPAAASASAGDRHSGSGWSPIPDPAGAPVPAPVTPAVPAPIGPPQVAPSPPTPIATPSPGPPVMTPPASPNPVGSALALGDVDAAFDATALPRQGSDLSHTARATWDEIRRDGRAGWQAGRSAAAGTISAGLGTARDAPGRGRRRGEAKHD